MKVLVYDKDEVREVIAELITKLFPDGTIVDVASDPNSALELTPASGKKSYDLVISGFEGNGEICGTDVLYWAKKINPGAITVLSSGNFEAEHPGMDIKDALGYIDFLWTKPTLDIIGRIGELMEKTMKGGAT